jgi:hypothetical protein
MGEDEGEEKKKKTKTKFASFPIKDPFLSYEINHYTPCLEN